MEFTPKSEAEWRAWLAQNGTTQQAVWLELFKKDSGVPSLTVDQAIDQAMCYGWVDSKPRKKDHLSYYLYFTPRNPKSNWSQVNKDRIARLEAEGLIAPEGQRMITLAKETGTWDALYDVDHLIIHDDLRAGLAAHPPAPEHFQAFPRSVKRGILEWIYAAKRPATRASRIRETALLAQQNKRANQYPRETLD